jgi:GT2 family glycosyltransferase
MAAHLADIDLDEPLPEIGPYPAGEHVLALLRRRGRPVGLLWVQPRAGWVRAGEWQVVLDGWKRQPAAQAALTEAAAETKQPTSGERLSMVVCTHERPDDLRRCLAALRPLAAEGHEVIVVDNAPTTARTRQVVADAGFPMTYLCEPQPGLDRARNRGWQAARQPLVAFTDDDAVPDPRWASAIADALSDPAVAGVAGLVMPLELDTPAQAQFETYCAHRRVFVRRAFAAVPASPAIERLAPAAAGVVGLGANLAFRRAWLERLGGFDPRLDGGTPTCSGGDTDMCARVLAAGGVLVYTPAALVWHRHRRGLTRLRHCLFGYGVGLTSFLTKRLVEAQDPQALVVAVRWTVGPFFKAARRRRLGQPAVPVALLLVELAGALIGPLRFWQVQRTAQRQLECAPHWPMPEEALP